MSEMAFLDDVMAESGLIEPGQLTAALHITKAELASALGVSRDSVAKAARARAPATQARLRDVVEILNRVRPWAGSSLQAFAWYRSQPIASFGYRTPEQLVREGKAEGVKRYLDAIAVGGYA